MKKRNEKLNILTDTDYAVIMLCLSFIMLLGTYTLISPNFDKASLYWLVIPLILRGATEFIRHKPCKPIKWGVWVFNASFTLAIAVRLGAFYVGLETPLKIIGVMVLVLIAISAATLVSSGFFEREEWQILIILYERFFVKEIDDGKFSLKIGEDKRTHRPVRIPYEDNFLHKLVLGSTGSGKTSQSLIPEINQILQDKSLGLTVIEPKGDLAEKAFVLSQYYGRQATFFNPIYENCPKFNALYGQEEEVVESIVSSFNSCFSSSPQYFIDMNEQLVRKALMLIKRVKGNTATFIHLNNLITGGKSEFDAFTEKHINQYQTTYSHLPHREQDEFLEENRTIHRYFTEYFDKDSEIYKATTNVRAIVDKLISNKTLKRILCPEDGRTDLDFKEHIDRLIDDDKGNQSVIFISTAQGKLKELGSFLGYLLIYQIQNAVFNRRGDEDSRSPHFLYIDECQVFIENDSFQNLLTQGRSYRCSTVLATQSLSLIAEKTNPMVEIVKTNCRNIVLFAGLSADDGEYFERFFGLKKDRQLSHTKTRQSGIGITASPTGKSEGRSITEIENSIVNTSTFRNLRKCEAIVSTVEYGNIQPPRLCNMKYIDATINERLNEMIRENRTIFELGGSPSDFRNSEGDLRMTISQIEKILKDEDPVFDLT